MIEGSQAGDALIVHIKELQTHRQNKLSVNNSLNKSFQLHFTCPHLDKKHFPVKQGEQELFFSFFPSCIASFLKTFLFSQYFHPN